MGSGAAKDRAPVVAASYWEVGTHNSIRQYPNNGNNTVQLTSDDDIKIARKLFNQVLSE